LHRKGLSFAVHPVAVSDKVSAPRRRIARAADRMDEDAHGAAPVIRIFASALI
jgi:hypothetical protein